MMAWVQGDADEDVEGGGTEFPLLRLAGRKERWCRFIECGDDDEGEGVTFKVKAGNAVYWENFQPNGRGYEETWHAGLPVKKGVKVGLNIWSSGRTQ
jgi:prolyl 4-hydroxylase